MSSYKLINMKHLHLKIYLSHCREVEMYKWRQKTDYLRIMKKKSKFFPETFMKYINRSLNIRLQQFPLIYYAT